VTPTHSLEPKNPFPAVEDTPAKPKDLDWQTSDLNIHDLELLHHWTANAYAGFGDSPGDDLVWRDEVTRLGLLYPFLMRGILAVSALHLARLHPTQKEHYLSLGAFHQNLALPCYRYLLSDIANRMDQDNCHAVLFCGELITSYAFARPHSPGSFVFAGLCSSTGVPEWLRLQRGMRSVREAARKGVRECWQAVRMRDMPDFVDFELSPDDGHLAALEEKLELLEAASPEEESEKDLWKETLMLLRKSFAVAYQYSEALGFKSAVLLWCEMAPSGYLENLAILKPVALVLLAYVCALMKKCDHHWYINGAPERIINEVSGILNDKWREWIEWPTQVVHNL
jgi:hypothetical protein